MPTLRHSRSDFVALPAVVEVSMLASSHKKTRVPQPVVAFLSSTCLGQEIDTFSPLPIFVRLFQFHLQSLIANIWST